MALSPGRNDRLRPPLPAGEGSRGGNEVPPAGVGRAEPPNAQESPVTPDIVVDIGNSRMKWGRCEDGRVVERVSLPHSEPVVWKRQAQLWGGSVCRWAVAGVVPDQLERFTEWLSARGVTPHVVTSSLFTRRAHSEFVTSVEEPSRIGVDRLLNSFAAWSRGRAPVSVISVGTAMTIDFVKTDGAHVGGVILPGPRMMAKALHDRTAKLPQVDIEPELPTRIWGRNTETAIQLGIANAVLGAADQLIWDWAVHVGQPPWVFATGGDVEYFRGFVFTADVAGFEIDPHLTLDGVRLAAEKLP